jgi:hypothetical protein
MNRQERKSGRHTAGHAHMCPKSFRSDHLPDARQTLSRFDWLLYGYFLSIALEKSAKDRKRTKAHIPKSGNTA